MLIQTVKGCVIITKCVAHCGGQIVNKDGSFKFFVYVKIDNKTAKTFLQYTNTLNVKEVKPQDTIRPKKALLIHKSFGFILSLTKRRE